MADVPTYRLDDVTEVLHRLGCLVAERQIAFTEGNGAGTPDDLMGWWQNVAAAAGIAGDGEIGAEAYDSLRGVFNYVEGVIISCGAPDSFDIYEVCFESLAKIGFCLQSERAKELLLHLLETVHEVYDVLLSCVETYEWVQPGATGLLRLWMLQVIFSCFGYANISGKHLMELTDNDVPGAVSLISFILGCSYAPFQMHATGGRCLEELTTADCVFLAEGQTDLEDMANQKIAKLTAMLNRHVNGLIKGLIQFDVIESFGKCICQHQMSHEHTDIIVKSFLTVIHNSLLYCSENQKKLRQHLATQSTIVQDIMIPYVNNILPALYDNPSCGPALLEWQNLKSVLQTFVVVTFNINVFRPQLRDSDLVIKICQVPDILTHITMLELLMKTAINVDFTKGPYYAHLLQLLHGAFAALPAEQQERLQRRMTSENSTRLPYSRSSAASIEALAFALAPPALDGSDGTTVESRKICRKHKWRNAKNKNKKRKRLFGVQQSKSKDSAPMADGEEEDDDDEGEDDSDDDDMPPLIPADGWEATLGAADEVGVPSGALCQLSGTLMHDPVATPEGNVFERVALEDWMAQSETNPLTGAPLAMADCQAHTELQSYIQGYQMQMLSACQVAPKTFDSEVANEAPAPAPATGPSLLGDLPSLAQEAAKPKKKEKGKIRIESRSVVECPEDMRCAIDGKVTINPVRSPEGHLFEKKTLDKWFLNCGSVCPISGKALRPEDCQPDPEMKKRIVKFLKGAQ